MELINTNESAWEFEIEGSKRSASYDDFYCYNKQIFKYVHGIEKGKWKKSALRWLKRNNFNPDLNHRKTISNRLSLIHFFGKFKKSRFTQ